MPQLWFVTTTGLVFLVLFLALSPYRDKAAGRIQLAALVQLEFTYVTAALFFDRQPKALQGEALVLCNSLVVLVMVVAAVRGIGVLGVELRELQLTFVDDRSVVQLPPLDDSFATHVYMSRQHANAQEQSSVIKGLLVTMLPTCKVPHPLCSVPYAAYHLYLSPCCPRAMSKHTQCLICRSTSTKMMTMTTSTSRRRSIPLSLPPL